MNTYRPTPQTLANLNFKPSTRPLVFCTPGSGRRYTKVIHMHYDATEHTIEVYNSLPAQFYKLASENDEQFATEIRILSSVECATSEREKKCRLI
jgi:hypothetical protein